MIDYNSILDKAVVDRLAAGKMLAKKIERKKVLEDNLVLISKAQAVVQSVAKKTQENFSMKLSGVVDAALDIAFPGEFKFEVRYGVSRGKTECSFVLIDSATGQEIDDILNAAGGGLVDVVCFAFRIAIYTLSCTDNVIILDEPFKYLSVSLQPAMASFLHVVSDKLNLQFIMTTHLEAFVDEADSVFKVEKKENVSIINKQEISNVS